MAEPREFAPGEDAPATATYEQVNIFGQPIGIRASISQGRPFPPAPIGHVWRAIEEGMSWPEHPSYGRSRSQS